MENQIPPFSPPPPYGFQPPLPNSNAVLVLGILSIVLSCCAGVIGIILGIIALSLAGKANMIFLQNPGFFSFSSYNNMKAGKICAIIGLIMSALVLIYYIIMVAFIGASVSRMPWDMVNT